MATANDTHPGLWDYTGLPLCRFSWEEGYDTIYVDINAAGLLWTGFLYNPAHGGDYSIGAQTFEGFFGKGPLKQPPPALLEEMRRWIERHRRPGPPPDDPNPVDLHGMTRLHRAASADDALEVKRLLELGIPVDLPAQREMLTPLECAARESALAAMRVLLEHGAALEDKARGASALRLVAGTTWVPEARKLEATTLLLEHGADVNAADRDGRTALFWAAMTSQERLMKLLLERGAKPDLEVLAPGQTLLMLVSGSVPMIRLLLEHGADVRAVDAQGSSVLAHAVEKNQIDAVRLLLEAGLDPLRADKEGKRPLDLARLRSWTDPQVLAALEAATR